MGELVLRDVEPAARDTDFPDRPGRRAAQQRAAWATAAMSVRGRPFGEQPVRLDQLGRQAPEVTPGERREREAKGVDVALGAGQAKDGQPGERLDQRGVATGAGSEAELPGQRRQREGDAFG